jgi:hypothetical protein
VGDKAPGPHLCATENAGEKAGALWTPPGGDRQLQTNAVSCRGFRAADAPHFGGLGKTDRLPAMTIYRTRYRDPKERGWIND